MSTWETTITFLYGLPISDYSFENQPSKCNMCFLSIREFSLLLNTSLLNYRTNKLCLNFIWNNIFKLFRTKCRLKQDYKYCGSLNNMSHGLLINKNGFYDCLTFIYPLKYGYTYYIPFINRVEALVARTEWWSTFLSLQTTTAVQFHDALWNSTAQYLWRLTLLTNTNSLGNNWLQ